MDWRINGRVEGINEGTGEIIGAHGENIHPAEKVGPLPRRLDAYLAY